MVTNNIINTSKPVAVVSGGTGSSSFNIYGPVVAGATSTAALTSISPSATVGIPFVSQGAAANPHFGTAVVAGGGTGITTTTAYGLITGGTTAAGAFQNVGTGSSSQVLTSGGASSLPVWVNNSSIGNMVLIQSQTASNSASINFTSGITSTYNNYILLISNCKGVSNAQSLYLYVSTNGGSSYLNSGYLSGELTVPYNSTAISNGNVTGAMIVVTTGSSTVASNVVLNLNNFTSGSGYPSCCGCNHRVDGSAGANIAMTASRYNSAATTINAFQIIYASGNISTGTFTLYGLLE